MEGDDFRIEQLLDETDAEVAALLVDLTVAEQDHYDHPRQSREQVARTLAPPRRRFSGENHVFVARDEEGHAVGVCWCVLFDPGTGLEGEVAELYVAPQHRGRHLATRLLDRATDLFAHREVSFACVWTHEINRAAQAAYRRAGFAPTEQTVLTWLPLTDPA